MKFVLIGCNSQEYILNTLFQKTGQKVRNLSMQIINLSVQFSVTNII